MPQPKSKLKLSELTESTKTSYQALFQELYEIQPQIEQYLFKFAGHRELAQDLCQEAYVKLYCAMQKEQPDPAEFAQNKPRYYKWLYTIARNLYIDNARRAQHERDVNKLRDYYTTFQNKSDFNVETQFLRKDLGEKIKKSLNLLPNNMRSIFKECVIEKTSREEVSSKYAISLSTLKRRLKAAKKLLSASLEEYALVG